MQRNLTDLYKEIILQHDRAPFHYQKVENPAIVVPAYNPLCGDQFKLFLNIEDNKIQEAYFHGYGCAISKASTSVLIQKMQGLPLENLETLLRNFMQMLESELETTEIIDQELLAFAAARQFPERLQCATLSWEALQHFLAQR